VPVKHNSRQNEDKYALSIKTMTVT